MGDFYFFAALKCPSPASSIAFHFSHMTNAILEDTELQEEKPEPEEQESEEEEDKDEQEDDDEEEAEDNLEQVLWNNCILMHNLQHLIAYKFVIQ